MKPCRLWICATIFVTCCWLPIYPARAEPYQLARSLQMLQDQMVKGNQAALLEQSRVLDRMFDDIAGMSAAAWKEPRNLRALVIYLVNSGKPSALREMIEKGGDFGANRDLIVALVAFAERRPDAAELLAKLDARKLERGIGGLLALAQGITFLNEPAKARPYFALARLLMPGSLIEEAALRRDLTMYLREKKMAEALQLATRYMWRFPSSVYASDVVTYMAETAFPVVATDSGRSSDTMRFIEEIPESRRRPLLLAVANEGLRSGKLELANMASGMALQSPNLLPEEQQRALAYQAIFKAFDVTQNASMDELIGIERERLGPADQGLIDAARRVAVQIRAGTSSPAEDRQAAGVEASTVILAAQNSIAAADESLAQATP